MSRGGALRIDVFGENGAEITRLRLSVAEFRRVRVVHAAAGVCLRV